MSPPTVAHSIPKLVSSPYGRQDRAMPSRMRRAVRAVVSAEPWANQLPIHRIEMMQLLDIRTKFIMFATKSDAK